MAIKKFKPTSPALREMTVFISDEFSMIAFMLSSR